MQGLIADWEALPREHIAWRTISASGVTREDAADAIRLSHALAFAVRQRLTVTAGDGYALALSPSDVHGAYLACLSGTWTLIFPGDGTRRRFVKHPVSFEGR